MLKIKQFYLFGILLVTKFIRHFDLFLLFSRFLLGHEEYHGKINKNYLKIFLTVIS